MSLNMSESWRFALGWINPEVNCLTALLEGKLHASRHFVSLFIYVYNLGNIPSLWKAI